MGGSSGPDPRLEAFRQGLRDLGYIEGKGVVIELRFAEGKEDRLPEVVAELVHLNVEIIVTDGTSVTRAAKNATKTIPIVMASDGDPIGNGFVASLAHPGGNITGLTNLPRRSKWKEAGGSKRGHPWHFPYGGNLESGKPDVGDSFQRNAGRSTGVGDATAIPGGAGSQRFRWRIPSCNEGPGERSQRSVGFPYVC